MSCVKGRAPWYDLTTGRVKDPLIIGVGGGTCSGKSEFCEQIKQDMQLVGNQLVCLSEHSFYKTPPPGRFSSFPFSFSFLFFFSFGSLLLPRFLMLFLIFFFCVCVCFLHSIFLNNFFPSNAQNYNWDHPAALDFDLFYETINAFKCGKNVEVKPKKHSPHDEENNKADEVYGADVLLIVGTLVLYEPKLRELMDLKVCVG